jgi:hypothetical protein
MAVWYFRACHATFKESRMIRIATLLAFFVCRPVALIASSPDASFAASVNARVTTGIDEYQWAIGNTRAGVQAVLGRPDCVCVGPVGMRHIYKWANLKVHFNHWQNDAKVIGVERIK